MGRQDGGQDGGQDERDEHQEEKEDLIVFPHRIAPEKQPEIFRDLSKSGKFSIVFTKTIVKLQSPGPSSTKLKFLGFPNFSQQDISQIVIISENKLDIVGAVTKSPSFPKGIFLV